MPSAVATAPLSDFIWILQGDLKTGGVLHSPLLTAIVPFIFLGGALAGIAYGVGAGTMKSDAAVVKAMSKSMETLGSYMVLVFFAAQFVAWFNWSHLGLIGAVKGAELLKATGLGGIVPQGGVLGPGVQLVEAAGGGIPVKDASSAGTPKR